MRNRAVSVLVNQLCKLHIYGACIVGLGLGALTERPVDASLIASWGFDFGSGTTVALA